MKHLGEVVLWLMTLMPVTGASQQKVQFDIQFFGDVYIPPKVLKATKSDQDHPQLFDEMREILKSSRHNVVNLEGSVTDAFVPFHTKNYLLKMPLFVPKMLRLAHIDTVTLANNHTMDFGPQGLFDTLRALEEAGLHYTGAGANENWATYPLVLSSPAGTMCLLAFSQTLPEEFWATEDRPGTAHVSFERVGELIRSCTKGGHYTVATFHWGMELSPTPHDYQRTLARLAIDAGAALVVGHHPHVLQEIEFYKGRPILYSLGNFAFGTLTKVSPQEGAALRLRLPQQPRREVLELVPLMVHNDTVAYQPRPLRDEETDPIASLLPKRHPCRWAASEKLWRCQL